MRSKVYRKKRELKIRRLAAMRYILPFSVSFVMLILFILPCFYFTDYSGDIRETTSIFARMSDNFEQARQTLLGSRKDVTEAYLSFSITVMTLAVACYICFGIGLVVSFMYMLTGLLHLYSHSESTAKLKRIFITFIPNKIVVCVLTLFTAVPSLFPRILVITVDRLLMNYTRVHYIAGDLIIWCVVLWILPIVFFILTKKYDIDELNIFALQKPKAKEEDHDTDTEEEAEEQLGTDEATVYRMSKRTHDEQVENLRKLLKYDSGNTEADETEALEQSQGEETK